jgi:hypothetical protein
MVKANWDAAIDLQTQRMGVGMVLRDDTGCVLAALSSFIPSVSDPTVAKALALWKTVAVCIDLGVQRLHLEGDALEVVQALQHQGSCWSRYGHLIDDSRIRLDSIQEWRVSHAQREANEVTHNLAKAAIIIKKKKKKSFYKAQIIQSLGPNPMQGDMVYT